MWFMFVGSPIRRWHRQARLRAPSTIPAVSGRQPLDNHHIDLLLRQPDNYPLFRHFRRL